MDHHFDVIIIGTGAGGATLAQRLAPSGLKILMLERGDYVPREKANWSSLEVNLKGRYQAQEEWRTNAGEALHPHTNYNVGGNTKFFGAALFRLREADFGRINHYDGVSPAWPISYNDLEAYYTEAEQLFEVRGERGVDPLDPPGPAYPFPPISHEERLERLSADFAAAGLHPFHTPLGVRLDEQHRRTSRCIRCSTCDGYPCLLHAKSDAEMMCIEPTLQRYSNVTLLTGAKVTKLKTGSAGKQVTGVAVRAQRREPGSLRGHRSGVLRRDQFGRPVAALRRQRSSERVGEPFRCRGAALYGAHELGGDGALAVPQSDRISKDAFSERLLLRIERLGFPDGPHFICRQTGQGHFARRRPRYRSGMEPGRDGSPFA